MWGLPAKLTNNHEIILKTTYEKQIVVKNSFGLNSLSRPKLIIIFNITIKNCIFVLILTQNALTDLTQPGIYCSGLFLNPNL